MQCDGLTNCVEEMISKAEERMVVAGYYFTAVWVANLGAFTYTAKKDNSDEYMKVTLITISVAYALRALIALPGFADQKKQTIICASEVILLAVNIANDFELINWILLQTVLAAAIVTAQCLYHLIKRAE